jgi:uncharacterized membrane protein YfhO
VIVFSEIYYAKGWNAYLNGNLVPHFRTNYILRGLVVPKGDHVVEFKFEPTTLYTTESISLAASSILIALMLGMLFVEWKRLKKLAA